MLFRSIAFAAFLAAFGLIWHIWWLVIVGMIGVVAAIIIRATDEEPEYLVTKEMVLAAQKGKM